MKLMLIKYYFLKENKGSLKYFMGYNDNDVIRPTMSLDHYI